VTVALAVAAACGFAFGGSPRPVLQSEQTLDTADGHFRIHYTASGGDATTVAHVGWAAAGLATVWDAFVVTDGWDAPPPDEGEGGDDRLDVYIRVITGNGYAHIDPLPSGASGCWIELDPGIAGVGEATFQSVAGHELHHCLQFRQTEALAPWIYEATSTYVQYLLFSEGDDALELAREALWRIRLAGAAEPLDDVDGSAEYAAFAWAKMMVDRAGDRGELLAYWQAMAADGTWELPAALDDAAELAVWQWFVCDRDDGRHWAADPAACSLDADVRPDQATPPASGASGPVGRYGSSYVQIVPDCTTADLHVEVTTAGARIQLIESTPWTDSTVRTGTSLDVTDWNQLHEVVLIGTDDAFDWTITATGTYTPPANLPPLAGIAIDPDGPLDLLVGDTVPVSATAIYGTCEDGAAITAVWESSDDRIAQVLSGEIIAHGAGDAVITATAGGRTATLDVHVEALPDDGGCCRVSGGDPGGAALLLALIALLSSGRSRRARSSPRR
jgi:hypothetical protein